MTLKLVLMGCVIVCAADGLDKIILLFAIPQSVIDVTELFPTQARSFVVPPLPVPVTAFGIDETTQPLTGSHTTGTVWPLGTGTLVPTP